MTNPSDLYQKALLSLSRNPLHKGPCDQDPERRRLRNPICGDDIEVSLSLGRFDGYACALCTASAELLCRRIEELRNGNGATEETIRTEVKRILMLLQHPEDSSWSKGSLFDDLKPLLAAHRFPSRLDCVLLPWRCVGEEAEDQ
ncbi:iron-sulfur cluster assembly scaffold protein [Sediminispirochaeta smaragdinae]|uniref:Nitrogen-fixing NifU domain protein n=1 Tax=Sediminispirochaeta smaragdinae (strain DSM 11293 / JCM 15392 / SEBR 4228) TaxID=573413 RepID=E1R512_SEDSS|nr:iron-sulfur cluster assembly scaffold protein [Sediminispirochaeta smaragdinae]ADK80547.1 hypothetical protein Spirs_1420 [Sediminispirochaeta smaragdinae DSM 11293]